MKKIICYIKDRQTIEFLKNYFKSESTYSVDFPSSIKSLKSLIKKSIPLALIVESPYCLERTATLRHSCHVIALVNKDITKGMKSIVKHDIDSYLIAPFYKEDLDYQLSVYIRKIDYYRNLYQDNKDLEALTEMTYVITSTLNPKEVLYLIVKKLSMLMPVTRCSILSIKKKTDRTLEVVSTFENPNLRSLSLDVKKYPEIKKAINTKQSVIIENALIDPLMKDVKHKIKPLGIKSIIVTPILFRNEVIGTLFLRTSRKTYHFSTREISLCRKIAGAASIALNNAYLYEALRSERAELEKLAITDFLTGIYNIRYLYHSLETEFSRSRRYGTDLSCIMLDIDHFKNINDTYGHRAGDTVLREFAELIKKHSRKSDIFARYGGEEFILIMPQTPLEGATIEANRLKSLIKQHHFKGIKKNTSITISIGVSRYPNKNIKTQDDLINFADRALLQAKDQGRDRIVIHE